MSFSNHLIHETSPYLLQHAHNPVDWYPWGEEALQRAKAENKPILVSIGYAACHWCHVMERESFEDEATAKLMNNNFINIKIDREERPDLDHIYMDAVQAMTGSGGWPLNVFLTPDAKPFYGGTYFPPQRAYNRPSWQETLLGVAEAFKEKRHEVDAQAENLTEHLLQSNAFGMQAPAENESLFVQENLEEAFKNIMKQADRDWGGFGRAPKFPQTFSIQFLLRYHHFTGNKEALQQALLSLDKMIDGGIYDQVGGGFARYSTDTEWLAPHFEKMLYDNALLLSVISEAFQLTGTEKYRRVIDETMAFVQRELMHPWGGFYAALDADSEGVEGKFYVWSWQEVQELLGAGADLFCEYYDISEKGNWEHTNILRVRKSMKEFSGEKEITEKELDSLLAIGKQKLLAARNNRVRPLLDDKIILGWNALMNTACCKVYGATGNEEYRNLAVRNMEFLWDNLAEKKGKGFHHTWKNNTAKYPAFADDLSFLVEALLNLQEVTGDTKWLEKARSVSEYVLEQFTEEGTGFFYYTPAGQQDVILRKKEVYDGAVPSGNSVMAYNLLRLSVLLDKKDWKERSARLVSSLGKAVMRYPTSFGNWLCLSLEMVTGTMEIAVVGKGAEALRKEVIYQYIPHCVLMTSETGNEAYPLLAGKVGDEKPTIFLCRNYTCEAPVFSTAELMLLINRGKNP